MASRQLDEEVIFHVARGISDGALRSVYLGQICAGDQALRNRVEALLDAHDQSQEFLASVHVPPAPTVECPGVAERPGVTIGRYRLMEQIGEGGMGIVFVAEQQRPLQRKVALKVIKPGMDSKAVIARFDAERQALALMDHPNIAKVLDAGTTDSGRPYFVMELVRGIPITEYCDHHKLTVPLRLSLFIQVCRGIQHAHQKGVIHRDIKPSNVLVTLHDGEPLVKVIDFGVAKALHQRLTEHTVYTNFAQVVGTPLYMSPEQAEFSSLDIDTRSDVYSLGVVLYELLTGTTPFTKDQFDHIAYDAIRKLLRDQEPQRASVRISSLGATVTEVANARRTTPEQLCRFLRRDLDWIVAKALEKDRTRRYETASAFADDVDRFLRDELVAARPPSRVYRAGKFVKRNRTAVITSGLTAICVLAALGVAVHSAVTVSQQRNRIASLYFRQILVDVMGGNGKRAELGIAEAATTLDKEEVEFLRGMRCLYGGDVRQAEVHFDAAVELRPTWILPRAALARARIGGGGADPMEALRRAQDVAEGQVLSPLEKMLLAHPQCILETTSSSLDTLREVAETERTPLALTLLAEALTHRASAQGDRKMIKEALEKATAAESMVSDNAYVLGISLFAHFEAIGLEEDGHKKDAYFEKCRQLADQLQPHPNGLGLATLRAIFYGLDDDMEGLNEIEREAPVDETLTLFFVAAAKYRHGKYAEAAALLDRVPGSYDLNLLMAKARALAFTESSDSEIKAIYARSVDRRFSKWWTNELMLLMQGDRIFRRDKCTDRLASGNLSPWEEALVRYIINDQVTRADEDDLVTLAKSSAEYPRSKLSQTYEAFALKHFGCGDRAEGAEYLQRCIDVGYVLQSLWARAYLERLKREESWPCGAAASPNEPISPTNVVE